MEWLLPAVLLVVGVAAGYGISFMVYTNNTKNRIRQNEAEARLQLESARAEQKEIILNAKDEAGIACAHPIDRRTPLKLR